MPTTAPAYVRAMFVRSELTCPVTLGAASTFAFLDDGDVVAADETRGDVKDRRRSIGIYRGALGVITPHSSIVTVGAPNAAAVVPGDPQYRVVDEIAEDDGEVMRVHLVPVAP